MTVCAVPASAADDFPSRPDAVTEKLSNFYLVSVSDYKTPISFPFMEATVYREISLPDPWPGTIPIFAKGRNFDRSDYPNLRIICQAGWFIELRYSMTGDVVFKTGDVGVPGVSFWDDIGKITDPSNFYCPYTTGTFYFYVDDNLMGSYKATADNPLPFEYFSYDGSVEKNIVLRWYASSSFSSPTIPSSYSGQYVCGYWPVKLSQFLFDGYTDTDVVVGSIDKISGQVTEIYNTATQIYNVTNTISSAVSTISSTVTTVSNKLTTTNNNLSQLNNTANTISNTTSAIKDVATNIDSTATQIKNTVSDTSNQLQDKDSNIWNAAKDAIGETLQNMFVPSEEDMTELNQQAQDLAKDKLGGAYTAMEEINDTIVQLKDKMENPTPSEGIEFPGIGLPAGVIKDQGEIILAEKQMVTLPPKLTAILHPVAGTIFSFVACLSTFRVVTDMVECFFSGYSYSQFLHRNKGGGDDD